MPTTHKSSSWTRDYLKPESKLIVTGSGRGAGKSHEYAAYCVIRAAGTPGMIIVIMRSYRVKADDGALQLCREYVKKLGIRAKMLSSNKTIRFPNGSLIKVEGHGTRPQEIKGLEGVDLCWVEEGQTITKEALDILLPTVLRKPGSQVIISYNPTRRDDAVNQLFESPPPYAVTKFITIDDNRFAPPELLMQRDAALGTPGYAHIWEGGLMAAGSVFDTGQMRGVRHADYQSRLRHGVRCWDLAYSQDSGDYTAGILQYAIADIDTAGKTCSGEYYISDVQRGQWGGSKLDEMIRATALRDGPTVLVACEDNPQNKIWVRRLLQGIARDYGNKVKIVKPNNKSKLERAQGVASAVGIGSYMYNREAAWRHKLLDELAAFQSDGYPDDQVDSLSYGYELCRRLSAGTGIKAVGGSGRQRQEMELIASVNPKVHEQDRCGANELDLEFEL